MPNASPYGRVLRAGPDGALVGTPNGVVRLAATALREGDLVRLADGAVVAANRSAAPLDAQDWWRLQRILPNLMRRADLMAGIRAYFHARGFLEVETPIVARSPGLEVHLAALETRACGEPRYLITSPEYHMKRLLSAGVPRILYLGRAFRDDERGHEHLTEFTMAEWYRADEGPDALMADVEALVALATGRERPWTRLTVAEALERWAEPTEDPDLVLRHLVERVEPEMAKLGAVFLTEWPRALASLARLKPGDESVSERFEAYVDGVELANGFGELTDAAEQRARFEHDLSARRAGGLPEYPIDEAFLDALAAGLPPCAGIALGVDRLVMLATGAKHIDDVTAFPPRLS